MSKAAKAARKSPSSKKLPAPPTPRRAKPVPSTDVVAVKFRERTHRSGKTLDATAFAVRALPAVEPSAPSSALGVVAKVVSPELALLWLEHAAPNRRVSQIFVEQYARDMRLGRWAQNGETIKFNRSGQLIDGQHRLWAVAVAGVAVPMLVVTNTDDNAQDTVDTGRHRSFAAVLQIQGEEGDSRRMAAALVLAHWYDSQPDDLPPSEPSHARVSHADQMAALENNPDLREALHAVTKARLHRIVSGGLMTFAYSRMLRAHPGLAEDFLTALQTGTGLAENNPAYRLRERLIAERLVGARIRELRMLELIVRAWNMYATGKTVRAQLRMGAARPTTLPKFVTRDDINAARAEER